MVSACALCAFVTLLPGVMTIAEISVSSATNTARYQLESACTTTSAATSAARLHAGRAIQRSSASGTSGSAHVQRA